MKKLPLAGVAVLVSSIAGCAFAADMPFLVAAPVPLFSWTSCFLGAHIGGGWAQRTRPTRAVVQDAFLGSVTTGVTTVGVSSNGLLVGGQMGCDYQFGYSNWVLGAEGASWARTCVATQTSGSRLAILATSRPSRRRRTSFRA